jgi:hypothetical protein
MKAMVFYLIALLSVFFISCESTPTFSSWYESWIDSSILPDENKLKESDNPRIITTSNIDIEFFEVLSNLYYCIGETSFNGPDEDYTDDIKTQCRQNGATIALYNKEYTDTRSGISGYGNYIGTYNIRRYDYTVYYFVPLPSIFAYRLKFGIDAYEIPNNLRQEIERNTGAYANVVYKNTPAFYANIIRGDVIIRINEYDIMGYEEFYYVLDNFDTGDEIEVEYVRRNNNNIVKIKL